ncbi:MAG: carboxylating nicotinate-nucleotide diphosphorylase [Nitrososphaerales archaeon]
MSESKEDILDPVLSRKIEEFLQEDLGSGDITTDAVIEPDAYAEAQVICREDAVVSGVEEAILTFNLLRCSAHCLVKEGDIVEAGRPVLKVKGRARSILKGERTALNILGRMSGVATETRRLVEEAARANSKIRVAATRKALPGFRLFDKKAVQSGGGDTHRFRLDDAVLIKDNHIKIAGSVAGAVESARKSVSFTKKIEVEASSFDEAIEAAEAGADIVMLDNMRPQEVSRVVKALEERRIRDRVFLEASGGIGVENIKRYSETGVDAVSSGGITHSARSIDFSLEIIGKKEVR